MNTIIFYHNDLDGLISALGYAYNDYIQNYSKNPDYKILRKEYYFYEVSYGIEDIFNNLKIQSIDLSFFNNVVILDYCFDKKTMLKFLEIYNQNLIWIDHHKNIIKEYTELDINGLRDHNNSAAVLVWKYFNKEPPLFTQYVEDMDIWNWQLPDSRDILQYIDFLYMSLTKDKDKSFKIIEEFISFFDNNNYKKNVDKFSEIGKIINNYLEIKVVDDISSGKKITFEGINTFIVNTQIKPGYISEYIYNSKDYKDIELVIIWYRHYLNKVKPEYFDKISLRSKNIDCSIIAKKYGGNGHPKASGFIIDDISKISK